MGHPWPVHWTFDLQVANGWATVAHLWATRSNFEVRSSEGPFVPDGMSIMRRARDLPTGQPACTPSPSNPPERLDARRTHKIQNRRVSGHPTSCPKTGLREARTIRGRGRLLQP